METLCANTTKQTAEPKSEQVIEATLEAIGYICQDIVSVFLIAPFFCGNMNLNLQNIKTSKGSKVK